MGAGPRELDLAAKCYPPGKRPAHLIDAPGVSPAPEARPGDGHQAGASGHPAPEPPASPDPAELAELAEIAETSPVPSIRAWAARMLAAAGSSDPSPPAPEAGADPRPEPTPAQAAVPNAGATVDTETLLRRLPNRDGFPDPSGPVRDAAERLAAEFGDQHSMAYYLNRMGMVADGRVPLKKVLHYYRKARGPGVESPGRVFTAEMEKGEAESRARPGAPP